MRRLTTLRSRYVYQHKRKPVESRSAYHIPLCRENITVTTTETVGRAPLCSWVKSDIFGAELSNDNKVYLFCLPKGHQPNDKTTNEVLSMVELVSQYHSLSTFKCRELQEMSFHCNNSSGQNKNGWGLCYICFQATQ